MQNSPPSSTFNSHPSASTGLNSHHHPKSATAAAAVATQTFTRSITAAPMAAVAAASDSLPSPCTPRGCPKVRRIVRARPRVPGKRIIFKREKFTVKRDGSVPIGAEFSTFRYNKQRPLNRLLTIKFSERYFSLCLVNGLVKGVLH